MRAGSDSVGNSIKIDESRPVSGLFHKVTNQIHDTKLRIVWIKNGRMTK